MRTALKEYTMYYTEFLLLIQLGANTCRNLHALRLHEKDLAPKTSHVAEVHNYLFQWINLAPLKCLVAFQFEYSLP